MKVAEFWASGFFLTQAESLISSDLHTIYSLDRVTVMGCIVQIKVTVLTSPQPQKRTGANRNVTRLGGRGGGQAISTDEIWTERSPLIRERIS